MSDPRPVPQYGEYATPEEVAALRGTAAPGSPLLPQPSPSPAVVSLRGSTLRRLDRPVTIALIAFGVLNLVQFAGVLLDFEGFLEVATKGTSAEPIDFTDAARIGGVVLFVVSLALVLASAAIAVLMLRQGRIAFWVPLVGGALSVLAWGVVLVAIVLQTPGALPPAGA
ncbi:DUF6264 family protein [Pseudolysinimonas sp.]|uniref:DUF6264 family protein n=1 Tax=Pseudolysinimonas sp. TaxID=2680009 RepID=UPI00286B9A82|nr:DUF6264 family protein [Pseudolysinimonas sp.]